MTYVSSLSLSLPLQASQMQTQASLTQLVTEESTGVKANLGVSLGAHTGTVLSLQSQIDQLNAYKSTNSLATTRLTATSNALSTILSSAQSMVQTLTEATGVGGTTTLQTTAASALSSLTGTLNTSAGNQYIFGGINSGTSPINANAVTTATANANSAFQTYLSGIGATASTITQTQMQTFLDGTFSTQFNNTNWQSTWSNASSQTMQTSISPSQSVATSVSANDSSLRPVAQAYTMLSTFLGQGLSSGAEAAVVSSASQLVGGSLSSLTNVASSVGVAQSALDSATTSLGTQVDVLTSNVSSLESVDPATLSTQITQLQTQLQASYELTSKLSSLSLVNYLSTTG